MPLVRWSLAAAVSALAAFLSLQHATPIDRALPLVAAAVTLAAAVSYSSVMVAVPLLVVAEVAIPDEKLRLLTFGAIVALTFAVAATALPRRRDDLRGVEQGLALAAAAIVLLRWIPVDGLMVGRELALMALALFLVVVLDGTPFAVAVAVVVALLTPAIPLRTLLLPLLVIAAAIAARAAGVPRLALTWPSCVLIAAATIFFPWSGVAARAFPWFLSARQPARIEQPVREAIRPGQSAEFDVPAGAGALVVSGANVAQFRRGILLGIVEPGPVEVRIGDAADWGYMRREQIHASHNPLPRDPAGVLRGYGYGAWVDGAGRIPLPRGVTKIRVTADRGLPAGAALQVEGFESAAR